MNWLHRTVLALVNTLAVKSSTSAVRMVSVGLLGACVALASGQGLSPKPAIVTNLDGDPSGVPSYGNQFLFKIPVENITSNTQTNVVGVAVPLSDNLTIVNPASDYGTLNSLAVAEGTPYRAELRTTAPVERRYDVKVGFKSDQGEQENIVTLPGNTGFGNGSQLAAWPPAGYGNYTTKLVAPAGATSKELLVDVLMIDNKAVIYGGSIYRNTRTEELIHVSSVAVEEIGGVSKNVLHVRRGQFGPSSTCEVGDVLEFEGVPIPDAVAKGVALKVPIEEPVAGAIGNLKVHIDSIKHPRIGDLLITLEDGVSTPVVLLSPLKLGLSNNADITNVTFDDNGTTVDDMTAELAAGGTYMPKDPLSTFADVEGTSVTAWTLRVGDTTSPFVGYIKGGWTLEPAN